MPVIETVEEKLAAIRSLCRSYEVRRLELVGSAARGEDFDSSRSDVDFLIEFEPGADLGPWLTRYFELKEKLEALLGCGVDLVMVGAASSPGSGFSRSVDEDRTLIYAAGASLGKAFGSQAPDG